VSEPLITAGRLVFLMCPSVRDIRATYERIADSYAAARRRPWLQVLDFIEGLPRGYRVLDLGCGHGRHARPLAAAGHRVVGVDLSRRLLTIGRAESLASRDSIRIGWLEGAASALPFRESAFDSALCIAVLHHIPSPEDRKEALVELRRVLRPGGTAFLSVWSVDDPNLREILGSRTADTDVEIPWRLPDGAAVPRFYHLFRGDELERLIIDSGLVGERFFRTAGNHFVQVRKHG